MIAEKCKRKIDRDTWDGLNATWHITNHGSMTLCGQKVGKEEDGWFIYNYNNSSVSCKKCAKKAHIVVSD